MKSVRCAAISLGLMLLLLATGCGAPAPAPAPKAAAPVPTPTAAPKAAAAAPTPTKAAAPAEPKRIFAGTTDISSSMYIYWVAVSKALNRDVPEINLTLVATGATDENIKRAARGEFAFFHSSPSTHYQAWKGIGPYEGKAQPDLRWLWTWSVSARAWIVREDSGVSKLEDLHGKPFNPGIRGSSTEKDTELMHEVLGIKPQYHRGGTDDAVAAIKDRRIVGYVKAQPSGGRIDASTLDLKTYTPIRFLTFTDEHISKIKEKYPYYSFMMVPAGFAYPGSPAYTTLSGGSGMATMKDVLSEELAYKITKTALQASDEIALGYKEIKGLNLAQITLESVDVPLHAGAVKYYRELGLSLKGVHIPPEAK